MLPDRLRFRDVRLISTFRLTLLLGLVFIVGVIILLGSIYILTARELTQRSDRILENEARRLLAVAPARLPRQIRSETGLNARGFSYLALISSSGDQIAGNIAIGDPPTPEQGPVDRMLDHGRLPVRLLSIRTAGGETILVGRDVSQIGDLRHRILLILIGSGMTIIVGMLGAAVFLSLNPLRRVRDLQRAAHEIASGRLSVRMQVSQRRDELDQFAATVNVMVGEVERALSQLRGVTDAIAHDLRTPLNRLRARLHKARNSPGAPASVTTLLADGVADLDIVLERFAALLRIAEIEGSDRRSGFGQVELRRLILDARDLYEPLAEERGIELRIGECDDAALEGDDKLLFEALSNLVDNAIKFAARSVILSARIGADGLVLTIVDDGPGIPPAERDMVLQRFYRGTNGTRAAGSGLGLSIVAAILHLHGFRLDLGDAAPGLIARIDIPRQRLSSHSR